MVIELPTGDRNASFVDRSCQGGEITVLITRGTFSEEYTGRGEEDRASREDTLHSHCVAPIKIYTLKSGKCEYGHTLFQKKKKKKNTAKIAFFESPHKEIQSHFHPLEKIVKKTKLGFRTFLRPNMTFALLNFTFKFVKLTAAKPILARSSSNSFLFYRIRLL